MNAMRGNLGWIEVICGPMFSGKSEELIRRLRRAEIARQRVQIFKPIIDQRYASDQIVSHDDGRIHAEAVNNAMEVQAKLDVRTEVIGIDEAQFLGEAMIDFVVRLADMGNLALGLHYCIIVYAITILFEHIAYTVMLPALGGLSAALVRTAGAEIQRIQAVPLGVTMSPEMFHSAKPCARDQPARWNIEPAVTGSMEH